MRVYELMNVLAEAPAGAIVKVIGVLSTKEECRDRNQVDEGVYSFIKNIESADKDENSSVIIDLE